MKPTTTDNDGAIKSDKKRGSFAKRIFELRIRRQFSQKNVPNVCESYIRSFENQNRRPSDAVIVKLASAYGYDTPEQLEELRQLADQQAKELAKPSANSTPGQGAIQQIQEGEKHVKIDLSRFSTELPPLELDYDTFKNFGHFLDGVYMILGHHKLTEPYNYGTTWLLKDKCSTKVFLNLRILERHGPGHPVADPRQLDEVGIRPGMELEAFPLVGQNPFAYVPNTKMP
jgi:transcriptional regulator with XRE-family HTH domain